MNTLARSLVAVAALCMFDCVSRAQEKKPKPASKQDTRFFDPDFADPLGILQLQDVQKQLKLSDTQIKRMKELVQKQKAGFRELRFSKERYQRGLQKIDKAGKEGPEKADFNRQAMGKIMKILNADQTSKFQQMTGKPFKGELPVFFPQGLYQGTSLKTQQGGSLAGLSEDRGLMHGTGEDTLTGGFHYVGCNAGVA